MKDPKGAVVGEDSRLEEEGPCVETSGWIRESNPLECGLEYQDRHARSAFIPGT